MTTSIIEHYQFEITSFNINENETVHCENSFDFCTVYLVIEQCILKIVYFVLTEANIALAIKLTKYTHKQLYLYLKLYNVGTMIIKVQVFVS